MKIVAIAQSFALLFLIEYLNNFNLHILLTNLKNVTNTIRIVSILETVLGVICLGKKYALGKIQLEMETSQA